MFKKIALVISAAALTAIPAPADAHHYYGYRYGGPYYSYPSNRYGYPAYGYGYSTPAFGYGYAPRYYGYNHYCSRDTAAGAAVGGVAGALLGSAATGAGHHYYGRRGIATVAVTARPAQSSAVFLVLSSAAPLRTAAATKPGISSLT